MVNNAPPNPSPERTKPLHMKTIAIRVYWYQYNSITDGNLGHREHDHGQSLRRSLF